LTLNELVLIFGDYCLCANFGNNLSRNVTVKVSTDGHSNTHAQMQTDYIIIIYPMLYAIAMGQIKTRFNGFVFI